MGRLIVIDGLDGSGKHTQTKLLKKALSLLGEDPLELSFPTYTKSSALIEMYLAGEFGENPGDLNPYAASAFFAVDRAASFLSGWKNDYEAGRLIICDRYTTANAIHQLAKIEPAGREEFLEWLLDFEYGKLSLPEPSLSIFLDVPVEVSQSLMERRYKGDEKKKDIHERNTDYLRLCAEAAEFSAKRLSFYKITCCKDGKMRAEEDIAADVLTAVRKIL